MKYTRILLATAFLGLSFAAQAEIRAEVSVTVPFDFVANGKTLPAGTYKVGRVSGELLSTQLLTNRENGKSVFVNPVEAEATNSNKPEVSFKQVGTRFFLSSIQTEDDVINFHIARSASPEASTRSSNYVSISGFATGK